MDIKLFLSEHLDPVFDFEKSQIQSGLSDLQVEMMSWDQPWRKESLAHYSQLGWSFVALNEKSEIQGYVLGQPILFFNNWTQTLWVEHLSFLDQTIGWQLMDTTIRWAKTKHLQKVLVNRNCNRAAFIQESFAGFKEGGYFHLSTTKLEEA